MKQSQSSGHLKTPVPHDDELAQRVHCVPWLNAGRSRDAIQRNNNTNSVERELCTCSCLASPVLCKD
ncbi:hypothetical protein KOW79_007764 [Hemibagrus wyckioides]|uniref:Uncharacterized protein n=1 Tax=Hemibagrus wyckioides TaxID=337641 RepID=A0A9D3NVM1_9TELE|nr:hypothetical protein KOW79_007764 [Hemibagrus wyckioides]